MSGIILSFRTVLSRTQMSWTQMSMHRSVIYYIRASFRRDSNDIKKLLTNFHSVEKIGSKFIDFCFKMIFDS